MTNRRVGLAQISIACLAFTAIVSACSSSSSSGDGSGTSNDGGSADGSDDGQPGSRGDASVSCSAGSELDCRCSDGAMGAQFCQSDGTYTECACGPVDGGDAGKDAASVFDAGYCGFNVDDEDAGTTATDTADRDSDGYSIAMGDCNDCDPLIHPGAGCP